jgi:hypothetical protein
MKRARLSLLAVIGGFVLVATQVPAESKKPAAGKPFEKELLQIAKDYKAWGRVDDEMRFAPFLCRMPEPGRAHVSSSQDADTHGQKLYSLFAKDQNAYFKLGEKKTVAIGQVVVKESWLPEEVKDVKPGRVDPKDVIRSKPEGDIRDASKDSKLFGDHFYPYATRGGKVFKATKPAGLFIMMKLDPKTPDTDDGWVYGTVSADLKTVTAAGKIESCMKCHQDAKYDRLFWFAKAE